jgi:transcription elongation GreA/GreB family factor
MGAHAPRAYSFARRWTGGKAPGDSIFHTASIRGFITPSSVNKQALIKKIVAKLTSDLELYFKAATTARAEATHEQSKAENKYDTRGLEASYLARGQSRQAAEIEGAIQQIGSMTVKDFAGGVPVDVGAYVELETRGETVCYFIAPRAGGTEVKHGRHEVVVITPQSPLGRQLLGRREGESLKLEIGPRTETSKLAVVA